jgi:hypothetical protein
VEVPCAIHSYFLTPFSTPVHTCKPTIAYLAYSVVFSVQSTAPISDHISAPSVTISA